MSHFIGLLCAAGIGSRMQAEIPKQYLKLNYQGRSQSILEITTKKYLQHSAIDACIIALHDQDQYFAQLASTWVTQAIQQQRQEHATWCLFPTTVTKLNYCYGLGARIHTVYSLLANAMELCLQRQWDPCDTFVLIHDVARPGISQADLTTIIETCTQLTPITSLTSQWQALQEVLERVTKVTTTNNTTTVDNVILSDVINKDTSALHNNIAAVTALLPGVRPVDSLKTITRQATQLFATENLNRDQIFQAQTPQTFNLGYLYYLLHELFEILADPVYLQKLQKSSKYTFEFSRYVHISETFNNLLKSGLANSKFRYNIQRLNLSAEQLLASLTDDTSVVLYALDRVLAVPLGRHNLKVTTPEDLALAQFYLDQEEVIKSSN